MKAVKKTVSSLEGVENVEIDYDAKVATITMKEGEKLDKETLDKAFADTKFKVEKFETPDADADGDSDEDEDTEEEEKDGK